MSFRTKQCRRELAEALDLDCLLEAMEDVQATQQLPEPTLATMRTLAALLRSERNDKLALAAELEQVEA